MLFYVQHIQKKAAEWKIKIDIIAGKTIMFLINLNPNYLRRPTGISLTRIFTCAEKRYCRTCILVWQNVGGW